jgi:hypothetical protein
MLPTATPTTITLQVLITYMQQLLYHLCLLCAVYMCLQRVKVHVCTVMCSVTDIAVRAVMYTATQHSLVCSATNTSALYLIVSKIQGAELLRKTDSCFSDSPLLYTLDTLTSK